MFCHVLNFPCIGRFATESYSTSDEDIDNMFIHLTNYSINKGSELFEPNVDPENPQVSQELNICSSFTIGFQGSKWTLTSLWKYLYETSGIERQPIWDQGFQQQKIMNSPFPTHLIFSGRHCDQKYIINQGNPSISVENGGR